MNKRYIEIGTILGVITLLSGAYAWDSTRRDTHIMSEIDEVGYSSHSKSTDLDLRLVDIELKHLRSVAERRPLTPDELDRQAYLLERRRILMEEQRKRS